MATYRIRLDPILHASFLAEERMDPFTREPLRAGMDVVVCARCQHVFDAYTWTGACPLDHSVETLPNVPIEKSAVRFEKSSSSNQPPISGLEAAFQIGCSVIFLIACWAGWQFGIRKLPQVVAVGNAVSTFQAGISSAFSPQPKQTPHPIFTPGPTPTNAGIYAPGSVILNDDFSSLLSGWLVVNDESNDLGYDNGGYHILAKNNNSGAVVITDNISGDVRIQLDARKLAGYPAGDLVIICRRSILNNEVVEYAFAFAFADRQSIIKVGGDSTKILQTANLTWDENAVHRLEADCIGTRFVLAVDGNTVVQAEDTSYSSGLVALQVINLGNQPVGVWIDNVIVSKP